MAKVLKVLFLFEDLCFGGTQKQNLALAAGLDRARFSPSILTLTGKTDLDGIAMQSDIPLHHIGRGRKVDTLFFAKLGPKLQELKPDILLPCTALPNIWGRLWGKLLKIPVIIGTCRGGGAPVRQHEPLLWRMASHIVCNSKSLLKAMADCGAPQDYLTYIPNGVDTNFFQPRPDFAPAQKPLIVCVARLAQDKDHKTLLRAFAIVAKEMPQAALRLVGEGPEEAALHKFVKEELPPEIAARVELSGSASDTRPHYADGAVFALSSIREGQPNVILEAMSCGLPVCATNVGGIPGILTPNVNGFLSNPGDAEGLASNLLKLLRDPDLRARFGMAGREFVQKNFSFRNMINAHQDLMEQLWNKKS